MDFLEVGEEQETEENNDNTIFFLSHMEYKLKKYETIY